MLTFGERLRMARERAGLTQKDVYKALSITDKSLSRYENNATSPGPDKIKALIELYNVSADFILGLSREMGRTYPNSSKAERKAAKAIACGDKELIEKFQGLSPEAKKKAAEYLTMLKTFEDIFAAIGLDSII